MYNHSKGSLTLTTIPDEQQIPGYAQLIRAISNALLHMTKLNRESSPHVVGPDGGVPDLACAYNLNTLFKRYQVYVYWPVLRYVWWEVAVVCCLLVLYSQRGPDLIPPGVLLWGRTAISRNTWITITERWLPVRTVGHSHRGWVKSTTYQICTCHYLAWH